MFRFLLVTVLRSEAAPFHFGLGYVGVSLATGAVFFPVDFGHLGIRGVPTESREVCLIRFSHIGFHDPASPLNLRSGAASVTAPKLRLLGANANALNLPRWFRLEHADLLCGALYLIP